MLPVEGHKELYRDEKSGAIINYDNRELLEYLKTKEMYANQKNEIDILKNEIKNIKSLLLKVIESKI